MTDSSRPTVSELIGNSWARYPAALKSVLPIAAAMSIITELFSWATDPAWHPDQSPLVALIGLPAMFVISMIGYGLMIRIIYSDRGVAGVSTSALVMLSIAIGLLSAIGFVLLVIPGLIMMLMWLVAIPALVVEQLPWRASLARSRQLMRGHWAPVIGASIVVSLVYLLVYAVLLWKQDELGAVAFHGILIIVTALYTPLWVMLMCETYDRLVAVWNQSTSDAA